MSTTLPSSDSSPRAFAFRDTGAADRWLNRAVTRAAERSAAVAQEPQTQNEAVRASFSASAFRLAAFAAIEAAAAQAAASAADPAAAETGGNPLRFDENEDAETSEESESSTGALAFSDTAPAARSEPFADNFGSTDNWVSTSGGAVTVGDGTFYPNASGGYGSVETKQSFAGAFELKFDLYLPGANDSLDVTLGGATLSRLADSFNTTKWGWHSVRIAYDGAGTAETYLDGADAAADVQFGIDPQAAGALGLANYGEGSARLRNFFLTPVAGAAVSGTEHDIAASAEDDTANLDGESVVAEASAQADEAGGIVTDEGSDQIADGVTAEAATDEAREQILLASGNVIVTQANVDELTTLSLLTYGESAAA